MNKMFKSLEHFPYPFNGRMGVQDYSLIQDFEADCHGKSASKS